METQQPHQNQWYDSKILLIILLFVFPPLGIYGILKRKNSKEWKKAVYIVIASFMILFFTLIIVNSLTANSSNYTLGVMEMNKGNYEKAVTYFNRVESGSEQYADARKRISEIEKEIYTVNENEKKLQDNEKKLFEEKLVILQDFQKKWADSVWKSESQVGNRHFVNAKVESHEKITFEYTESITKNGFNENLKVDTIAYKEFYESALKNKFGNEFSSVKTQINFIPNSKVDFQEVVTDNNRNAERRNKILMQFSQWDGSHSKLKRAVKDAMDDPSSFEHVKTTYQDKGSYILVQMSFRGTNAFGAKVLNNITAKVDENGNILSIN